MTALAAALALAAAGLPVFPCGAGSKRPLTTHGFYDATADADQIRRWWRRWPHALPAAPTGQPSLLWILDIDINRQTGETTGANSMAALGIQPPPHTARTRSGGEHWLYRWRPDLPRCSAGRLPGIDVRGAGGFVIAWQASVLIAAAGDRSLPPPPDELLAALAPPVRVVPPVPPVPVAGSASRWARAALAGEVQRVASTPEGHRNDELNVAGFKVGQLVGAGLLEREHVEAALMRAALMAGLGEDEAENTIKSGLDAGAQFPRVKRA